MSLIERARAALDAWRAEPAAPTVGGGPSASGGLYRASDPPARGSRELLGMYSEAPWLRAVGHKIAHAVATTCFRVYVPVRTSGGRSRFVRNRALASAAPAHRRSLIKRGLETGELRELTTHPLLDLIDEPNPVHSGRAARQVTQVGIDFVGECYWLLEENSYGMPEMAWPIPSPWVQQIPTAWHPCYEITWPGGRSERVPPHLVLPLRDPNPADPYGRGAGVGLSLRDEADADEYAAKHVSSWFFNKAMPDMIVSLKGQSQENVTRAKRKWESKANGAHNQYRTMWTSAEVDAKRLDTSFKDMNLVGLRQFERDTIVQTFGIPPEVLGIIENSNRATIDAADLLFAKHCLEPRLELWRTELQVRLVPRFDDRLILDYDSPVPEDRQFMLQAMQAQPAAYTVDEHRELGGHGPLEDDKGKLHLAPAGTVAVEELATLASLSMASNLSSPLMQATEPAWARELGAKGRGLTDAQLEQLLNAVRTGDLGAELEPVIQELLEEWGRKTMAAIDENLSFDPNDPEVQEHVREFLNDRLGRLVNTTTRDELRAALEDARAEGEDLSGFRARVRQVFRRAEVERSETIAETESLRSSQFAGRVAMKQSGAPIRREWLATADGRTRDAHRMMDGQQRGIDEPFEVPSGRYAGARTMTPGSFGIAALDIRCLLPGTVVEGTFKTGVRSRYVGKAVELKTRRGARLRVTANHPVLTPRGLIAAQEVRQGDHLVSHGVDVDARGGDHVDHGPAVVEQVFGALAEAGAVLSAVVGPDDLHGDARAVDGDVDVVTTDRALLSHLDPTLGQGDGELGLVPVDVRDPALTRTGSTTDLGFRLSLAAHRSPGGAALTLDGSPIALRPLDALRFGATPQLDAVTLKGGPECVARKAEFSGESGDGLPLAVSLDEVVEVVEFDFAGHVYDLQSPSGLMVADGLVVSNCRCAVGMVLIDQDVDGGRAVIAGGFQYSAGRATESERAAAWRAFDEQLKRWDERLARAAARGFAAQERAVIDALAELNL